MEKEIKNPWLKPKGLQIFSEDANPERLKKNDLVEI